MKAKHIGILACSAEGAALCYRTIALEAQTKMGEHNHPEMTMHTFPLSEYMRHVRSGSWDEVAQLMRMSSEKLKAAGASFAVCPDNTIHQGLHASRRSLPIPFIHIADAVGEEARRLGFHKLGITGTKYLMMSPVYPNALRLFDISTEIPESDDRERIDEVIFSELVQGVFTDDSRGYFNEVFDKLRKRGCDAVVLGCTEIPLLVDPSKAPLPLLDSTRLLARAALREALA